MRAVGNVRKIELADEPVEPQLMLRPLEVRRQVGRPAEFAARDDDRLVGGDDLNGWLGSFEEELAVLVESKVGDMVRQIRLH